MRLRNQDQDQVFINLEHIRPVLQAQESINLEPVHQEFIKLAQLQAQVFTRLKGVRDQELTRHPILISPTKETTVIKAAHTAVEPAEVEVESDNLRVETLEATVNTAQVRPTSTRRND